MKKNKLSLRDLSVKSFTTTNVLNSERGGYVSEENSNWYPTYTTISPSNDPGFCDTETEFYRRCAYNSNGLRTYCESDPILVSNAWC